MGRITANCGGIYVPRTFELDFDNVMHMPQEKWEQIQNILKKLAHYEDLEERIEKLFDGKIPLNEAVEEIEKKVHGEEVFRYSRILTNAEAEKWDKWLDLEEQGRLIELPCKVGDDVYFIPSKTNYKLNVLNHLEENNRVYHQKIERITIAKKYYIVECDADREYGTGRYFINDSFGETWFLTKEEALAKLEELKGGETDE